ncbi:MAG: aldolase, partial [Anaerolineae bacterium]|nr:aldolase [Anaerolineae bacterium]
MDGQQLAAALRRGQRVYGSALLAASPIFAAYAQRIGLDWAFLDTEHIPLDRQTLAWMCRAYAAMDIAPIVRVPYPDAPR